MKNKIRIVMEYEIELNKEVEAQRVKHCFIIVSNGKSKQYIYIRNKLIENPIGSTEYKKYK